MMAGRAVVPTTAVGDVPYNRAKQAPGLAHVRSGGCPEMAHEDLINQMIATYRDLNLLVRPIPDTVLNQRDGGQASIRDLMQQLRDGELRFTQATKELLTGQTIPDDLEDEAPIIGLEHEGDPSRVLLSQFGTARESLLAMLREMSEEQWQTAGSGGRTMMARITQLIENDRKMLGRVQSLVGSSTVNAPA
jgi:hypothetical protein